MLALEQLARGTYWRPLYVFVRQRGRSHDDAVEDVQGFFAHLIGRDFLRFVQPREGRFRTFLLASFHPLAGRPARSRARG